MSISIWTVWFDVIASGCGFARTCRVRGLVRLNVRTINRSPAAFAIRLRIKRVPQLRAHSLSRMLENKLGLARCSAARGRQIAYSCGAIASALDPVMIVISTRTVSFEAVVNSCVSPGYIWQRTLTHPEHTWPMAAGRGNFRPHRREPGRLLFLTRTKTISEYSA